MCLFKFTKHVLFVSHVTMENLHRGVFSSTKTEKFFLPLSLPISNNKFPLLKHVYWKKINDSRSKQQSPNLS